MAERGLREIAGDVRNSAGAAKKAGLLSGKNSRIGNGLAIVLMSAAAIADLFSLIPFVGDFVGPAFWIAISLYFWSKGFGFMRMGRLTTEIVSTAAEMVPVVQELPTIIVAMALVILLMRIEDKSGKSHMKLMSKGQNLNIGGRREPGPERQEPLNDGGTREASGHIVRV